MAVDQFIKRTVKGESLFKQCLYPELRLRGDTVELESLKNEHVKGLIEAARSGQLWQLEYTSVPAPEDMASDVQDAIELGKTGKQFPFVVKRAGSDEILGSTRYYYIDAQNRNLSIGFTWYAEHCHRTSVNTECKLLLLEHAFEKMGCISVQWHTDHRNIRSQAAIKRLGAKFEGVLRNHRIMPNGVIRHTHCFSMLDDEWPQSKAYLISRLKAYAESD